ncbi:MAG: BirA family biotin operon repressor/biotin-[acetyl-CoA-carboxylase] ligase [Paraglaciecola sp.]|jgi:BirA family biotin operon repressor/biotin-[acetyl-CoA-carboxylase] ligase
MKSINKQSDHIKTHLVTQLASGNFCSGEALGEQLGISRSAVSKHIKSLLELGLDIFSVTGKGYKLAAPIQLLASDLIGKYCRQFDTQQLEVLNVIDSTNQYLKDNKERLTSGQACVAEAQTAGRGRRGRKWVSPYGASLYLSMYWPFAGGYQSIGGLSLAVGVSLSEALKKAGYDDIQLKWPNDIYAQGKKLAGVLIEVEGQIGGACDCIIGIGLNMSLPARVEEIDQPWIDIARLNGPSVDRNKICALLLDEVTSSLHIFDQQGLIPFVQRWRALDVYRDQAISLTIGSKLIVGIGRGIDETGALLLQVDDKLHAYSGGEISVRAT